MSPAPRARTEGLIVRRLDDELLVYDLEAHEAHCLNRPAAAVWDGCDGTRTVPELAELMGDENIVLAALAELGRRGLLAPAQTRTWTPRLTRRQLVRRLGVAAALSVPVITSLTAPTAAQAASCTPNGGTCGGVLDLACCTGCVCLSGHCSGVC
jgi:hypothetical protein